VYYVKPHTRCNFFCQPRAARVTFASGAHFLSLQSSAPTKNLCFQKMCADLYVYLVGAVKKETKIPTNAKVTRVARGCGPSLAARTKYQDHHSSCVLSFFVQTP